MVQGARPPSIFSTAGLSPNKGQADWAQLYSFILQNRAQKFNLFLKIGRIFSNLEEKNRDTNVQYEVNIGKMLTLLILYLFK